MALTPQILFGNVMHKRLKPTINQFRYSIYYLALPLSQLSNIPIAYNRPGLLSFYDKDHGLCDGTDLKLWANDILKQKNLDSSIDEIVLICMPRILGYVFNPVSFWLCFDKEENLKCVLCEVHNTFGEKHTYVCNNSNLNNINQRKMTANKVFHVSPFLKRDGEYEFEFRWDKDHFSAYIDYYSSEGRHLLTSLTGEFENLTRSSIFKALLMHPLVTLKTIALIHWQALKLVFKKIRYVKKPQQLDKKISFTQNLNNN